MKAAQLIATFCTLAISAFAQAGPPTLPKVVLLGDSIREGYAPFVAGLLAGRANVITPPANGRDTGTLLANLDEWAIREQPDVIHFNCGIHDTKRNQATGKYQVPREQYETNLREIVKRLRDQTKAKVVFALSTPLIDERSQESWKTRSYRIENASVMEYNQIALRVMKELDVPVNDLPAALGDAAELARLHDAGGIHFTPEGSQKLGDSVASFVAHHLPAAAEAQATQPSAESPQARTLAGHGGSVLGLTFSPDGRVLVSSSRDATIKLWDARTGALQRTLTEPTADVFAVIFSPGGELLASCGADKTIRLWDARTFTVKAVLNGHTDIVRSVAFSPDGKTLASVSVDQTVRLWNVAAARLEKTLTGHTARVKSVAWSPDGRILATVASDKTLRLWNVATGAAPSVLEGHTGDIETVAWSADGETIATSSNDTTIRLWEARTGRNTRTLEGHTAEVDSVLFSPDGQTVISGSKDTTIRLWDRRTGQSLRTWTGHTGRVESLAVSPDGATLASGGGGGDTAVRLWELKRP